MSTLQEQLDAFKSEFSAGISQDKLELMARADQELAETSILRAALKEGDKAPEFVLPDHNGNNVSLYKTLDKGPTIVVFYRGAWCPYCNLELAAYQHILPDIDKAGVRLMAVSPQKPDGSLSAREKNELAYPVLSDSVNEAAKSFGILFDLPDYLVSLYLEWGNNLALVNNANTWALPIPATYVIRRDGIIVKSYVDIDYRSRLDPAEALAAAIRSS